MKRTRLTFTLAACIVGASSAAIAALDTSDLAAPTARARANSPPMRPAACPTLAGAMSVGANYHGKAARHARLCEAPGLRPANAPPGRMNVDATTYGDCKAAGEADGGGCAPALQVQTHSVCERYLGLYDEFPGPNGPRPYETLEVRGAPAALFDDNPGAMLEIYTDELTLVVFAPTRHEALGMAQQLRGSIDGRSVAARADLPQPVAGAAARGRKPRC